MISIGIVVFKKMNRNRLIKFGFVSGLGALLSSSPMTIRRKLFQINTYEIPVANLPSSFHGFSIAHLTDIHYGRLMSRKVIQYLVHKTNSLKTDAIVCTGDYIRERNKPHHIDIVWPELCKLKAKHGVYSVLGNHDHWGSFEKSMNWLRKSGQNVRHKAKAINKGPERIWIGGAGDHWEDDDLVDKAFKKVPRRDCKILLAHNPDTADTHFNTRVDLMISGHTHGGQVIIPVLGVPFLPVKNKLYNSGFIKSNKTNIYISRGLGWSVVPFRYNCLPELSVLKLIRE